MPSGQPLDPRAPERPTVAGIERRLDKAAAQLDRRIPKGGEPEFVVRHILNNPDDPMPPRKRGRMVLRRRAPGSADGGAGGPPGAPTLLGTATAMPPQRAHTTEAAVTLLPDGTVLLAYGHYDTGDVILLHYPTDLSAPLSQVTVPAGVDDGVALVTTPDGPVLLVDTGNGISAYPVNADPLTVGSPTTAPLGDVLDYQLSHPVAAGGRTVVAGFAVHVLTGRTVTAQHERPPHSGPILGLHPDTDRTVLVTTTEWDRADLYRLDLDAGTWTLVATSPVPPDVSVAQATTPVPTADGWLWPAVGAIGPYDDWPGAHLWIYDQGGAEVSGGSYPTEGGRGPGYTHAAHAPGPGGGNLLGTTWTWDDGTTFGASGSALHHVDPSGTYTTVELPHPGPQWSPGLDAQGVRLASDGRRVVAAATLVVPQFYTGEPNEHTVVLWSVDLGSGPVEGILDVSMVDGSWWTVGTRDPGMDYGMVLHTGAEWVAEIVAGEEPLATWELLVDPSGDPRDDWEVAALLRPA